MMEKLSLNFFGEEALVNIPKTLDNLRQKISEQFLLTAQDTAELLLGYAKDAKQKFIQTEEDFVNFIKDKVNKIEIDISPNSRIYKESLNKIQEEKKKEDKKKVKKDKIKKEKKPKEDKKKEVKKPKEDKKKEEKIKFLEKVKNTINKVSDKVLRFSEPIQKLFGVTEPQLKELKDSIILNIDEEIKKKKEQNKEEEISHERLSTEPNSRLFQGDILKGLDRQMKITQDIIKEQERREKIKQMKEQHKAMFRHILPKKHFLKQHQMRCEAFVNGQKMEHKPHPHFFRRFCRQPQPFQEMKTYEVLNDSARFSTMQLNRTAEAEFKKNCDFVEKNLETEKDEEKKETLKLIQAKSDEYKEEMKKLSEDIQKMVQQRTEELKKKMQDIKTLQRSYMDSKPKVEEKVVHKTVKCDGCGVFPIVGVRYKCAVCHNFDYCEKCEATLTETHQHPFIKIYKPQMAPVSISCMVGPKCPDYQKKEGVVVHRHFICDGCNKGPIIGNRYHCNDCKDFDYCEECMKKFGDKHEHKFQKIDKACLW